MPKFIFKFEQTKNYYAEPEIEAETREEAEVIAKDMLAKMIAGDYDNADWHYIDRDFKSFNDLSTELKLVA